MRQIIFVLVIFLLWGCKNNEEKIQEKPDFVWVDADGGSRSEYVYFKKSIEITSGEEVAEAELNIYADSRYALYVNGKYLGFGPVRSYHVHPYYDTYDLSDYLVEGTNCIIAKVLSNGMLTYQLFDFKGAFAAYGNVRTNKKEVSLESKQWKVKPSEGYDQTAPRFSFAAGPIENWNAFADLGWNSCMEDTGLKTPVVLQDSSLFGELRPRPIPKLTQIEKLAKPYRDGYYLDNDEILQSFRVTTKDSNREEYSTKPEAVAYTYIYSPKAQTVEMGLWWGNTFLNGMPLTNKQVVDETNYRKTYSVLLKKGWNTFHVGYDILWGSWDFYMAFPKISGLKLSVNKNLDDTDAFAHFMVPGSEVSQWYDGLAELSFNALLDKVGDRWTYHKQGNQANQPVRDLAWMEPDLNRPLSSEALIEQPFALDSIEKGIALYYAMEETQLGRFFIEGDFPKGTIIDLGFSEELDKDGFPWLYKRYQIGAGLRFVADGTTRRYESFKPYGAKYIHLKISDATEPFTLDKVGMVRMVYPFETKGSFVSNDSIFNKIHEAGWRTLQLCAEDSYTDTPFRERGLYSGDFLPELAITMAMSGDMRLGEHSLSIFQDMYQKEMYEGAQNRHFEFVFITLLSADYLSQFLNDDALIRRYYENYRALVKNTFTLQKQPNGLLKAERVFIEWSSINKENAAMTAYQAVVFKSLNIMESWANTLGKSEDAAYFTKKARELQSAVMEHLWNADENMFYDGIKDGEVIKDHHITSTIWPMLYGLMPREKHTESLKRIIAEIQNIGQVSRNRKITAYSSFYLLALLYEQGEVKEAENFIRKNWMPMALHSNKPTTWENFDIAGNQGTSSHAWSGHPTYFMATETLGVNLGFYRPFDPRVISIQPQSEVLNRAKGEVVHPQGVVGVDWKLNGNDLILNAKVPKGVPTTISPKGRLAGYNLILNKEEY